MMLTTWANDAVSTCGIVSGWPIIMYTFATALTRGHFICCVCWDNCVHHTYCVCRGCPLLVLYMITMILCQSVLYASALTTCSLYLKFVILHFWTTCIIITLTWFLELPCNWSALFTSEVCSSRIPNQTDRYRHSSNREMMHSLVIQGLNNHAYYIMGATVNVVSSVSENGTPAPTLGTIQISDLYHRYPLPSNGHGFKYMYPWYNQ